MFNSYVKLPEGNKVWWESSFLTWFGIGLYGKINDIEMSLHYRATSIMAWSTVYVSLLTWKGNQQE